MDSPSTQLATIGRMNIYEPFCQINSWGDAFKNDDGPNTGSSTSVQVDSRTDKSGESMEPSRSDQEGNKNTEKTLRSLAQNREAARKSRLRKKAYVQQLESSRLKLSQLEQELQRARQQGLYVGKTSDSYVGSSRTVNSGIVAFEMEHGHWIDEQHRQNCELRNALQAHISDVELRILVENGLNHYSSLFRMKGDAAMADVFYLMSGMWTTSVERFFQWIGGFRPSELLNVLMPQLEPLTDQQLREVGNLRHSSQQAEDALSQGIDKLQQSLAQNIATDAVGPEDCRSQMADAMVKLDALESFVNLADHLRQQTLQHMSRVLTTRQAARGLLALGEYFHRLHALSSLWAARPRDPLSSPYKRPRI